MNRNPRSKMARRLLVLFGLFLLVAASADAGRKQGGKNKNKKNKNKAEKTQSANQAQEADAGDTTAAPLPAALDRPAATAKIDRLLWAWDTDSARQALESTDTGPAETATGMGRVLAQEQQFTAAAESLREAADAAAEDPAPLVYLGETLRMVGDNGGAANAFQRAADRAAALVESHPGNPQALYWQGVAQLWLEQYGAAADTLAQAREAAPDDPMAAYYLGLTRASQERWADSVAQFDSALAVNDGIAYAYYYRGLAHGRLNRKDLMVADLERFLRLAPDSPDAPKARRLLGGV